MTTSPRRAGIRISARLRLALSYALFLVAAGIVVFAGLLLVLLYVPDFPLTAARPRNEFASREEILWALLDLLGIIVASLAVIGITGGWIIAGWILRPLQRINEAADVAATGRLDHRIHLTGLNDEFRDLADSFDHMLDRLHDAFTTHERFAANAAHELRTPLSVTATMLDVARADPSGQDYLKLLERLQITNSRAIGLTEALLRLADANAITAASEPLDLGAIVREAIAENADEAGQQRLTIEVDLAAAPVMGDPMLLQQLVENLVQNAIRHNLPDGFAHITIEHNQEEAIAVIRIENTGAAYRADEADRLIEPFQRGVGRVRETGGKRRGYGLGLALVDRITTVHEGRIEIAPRPGGGLITTVTLPARTAGRATVRPRSAAPLEQRRPAEPLPGQ